MTTAGTITVGVDINGNGLGPKLAAAVRAQLAPMLADINKQLGDIDPGGIERVSRAAGEAAKSAERTAKSVDKATEATKRQTRATDDLEKSTRLVTRTQDDYNTAVDIFGKRSAQAETALKRLTRAQGAHTDVLVRSAAASKSSTDSQIQDIERLTVAAEQSARRHVELQRSVSIGGGGGRGGGGNRTGFFGGGGAGGFLTSPAGLGATGLAANALPGIALVATNLTGAIQQLGQAGLVLPGVFAGIAASVGTAKLGFMGVGDALTEMFKAAKSGDPKDIKKAAEALKDIAPSAKETVQAIGLLAPELLKLQKDVVQENMFAGLGKSITDFTGKMLPTFKTGLGGIATAWNGTFKSLLSAAGSDSSKSFLDRIFGNTADAQTRANKAIEPIIHGLGQLATTGSNFLPRLADGLNAVATRFDTFITKAAADGRLDKWIDQGFKAVGSLGESFLNIGKIITSLTQAAGGDGGFFKMLETGTGKLADFLGSAEGQEKLTRFFDDARKTLSEWIPILGNIANVVGDVFRGLQDWGSVVLPVLSGVTSGLSAMPGLVSAAVTAFAGFKTISWLGGLASSLSGINGALGVAGGAGGKTGPAAAAAGGGMGILQKLALGGFLAYGSNAASQDLLKAPPGEQPSGLAQLGSGAVDVLGTAAGGALIGSAVGPWGAAIGAAVGALVGGVNAFVSQINTAGEALNTLPDKIKADAARDRQPNAVRFGVTLSPLDNMPKPENLNEFTELPKLKDWPVIGIDGKPVADMIPGPDGQLIPNPNKFQQGMPRGILPPLVPQGRNADQYRIQDTSGDENPFTASTPQALLPKPVLPGGASDLGSLIGVPELEKDIAAIPPVKIDVQSPDLPKAQQDLTGVQGQLDGINKTPLNIKADTSQAEQSIKSLFASYQGKTINVQVMASASGSAPLQPGHADGGVLPGYSPGADNMLVPMSGGEGVVIPEAMRALGGSWLYGINSRFRAGLSRRGYATGGVVGADGALGAPDNTVLGLLAQIRDAILGKGGGPLATTAQNTSTMADALGPKAKPFGGDVGKGALAGAIKALGGDPNLMDWGGYSGDGQLLVPKAGFNAAGLSAGVPPGVAAALQAFARSGNTADLGGGLSVTDPVVRAIVTARNKKTGLSDDQIAGLVGQVLGGGGFQGVLDPTNTPLVNALTAYQNKANRPVRGSAPVAAGTGVGLTPLGGFDAALLSQVPAGQYSQTGAADLTKGLADCSSSVEDLVNLMDGSSTAGRSLSTANAAQWFPEHGFLPGTMPGAFNVGFNSGHMQASLPDGTPFNWGSDAAAARGGVGGTGAFDPAFTQQFYRPVTGMPLGGGLGPGMGANPLGYSGGPVPVYIVDGPSASFGKQLAGQVAGQALDAMGQPLSDVAGSIITGIDKGTQLERDSTKNRPATPTSQLMKEGNPLSVAALAGYKVPDFSRKGWSGPVNTNAGPGFTAGGQMISDTSAIIQRSFADMEAANDARQQQLLAVLDAIKTQLSEQVLKPIIQSAVTAAMQAAGSGAAAGSMQVPGLAGGGGITGGVAGKDSVPALLMPGEHVFTTDDVARMGGQSGVYAFRRALYANGGAVRHFATGGGVNVNKTVGADFFGVGQVPIIGPLINLLINVLLQIIGVNIEAADTLNEISSSFNQFRGDFKRFDATGRVTADTSALSDRSGSSKEKAIDERVRIFKEVLSGLIKFIIQKIIIPITQAVMQTLLSTASSAVSGAISGGLGTVAGPAGPIVGNLVGGLINSAGGAAINIGGELISQLVGAATGPIVELITGGLMDMFGGLLSPILSGGIGGLVSMFLPFLAFDSGGVANGMGLLPKATVEPERVLSPRQTSLFEEMVRANFGVGGGDSSRHVTLNGGIHLHGSQATAEGVRNSLLTLMS